MPTLEAQKRRTKLALWGAGFATFLSMTVTGGALIDRFGQTNHHHQEQVEFNQNTKKAFNILLCFAERQAVHDKTISNEKRAKAVNFYNQALVLIKAPPCNPK